MIDRPRSAWQSVLLAYWITSFVEGLGVAQIYAFLPNRLAEVGVTEPTLGQLVGVLGSLFFLTGLPIVPLWGVWADKYSRKAVIIRSALVEALVFAVIGASQTLWQLVLGMLLVGFQLGNSGVMMAAIRDVTPRGRLGLAMALFAASSPLGFGAGPTLGAFMIDQLQLSSGAVFGLAALLSLAVAGMLALGSPEVRPDVVPVGRTIDLAFGAVRGVLSDPLVRWLFGVYGVVFLARQMSTQYLPLLIHGIEGSPLNAATSVGLVLGVGTVLGAAIAPLGGVLADRLGLRPMLVAGVGVVLVAFLGVAAAPSVLWLGAAYVLAGAGQVIVGAMVSGILASEVSPERRSATLNLIFFPLYLAGIAGPAMGAVVFSAGLQTVFWAAAVVGGLALAVAIAFVLRRPVPAESAPA